MWWSSPDLSPGPALLEVRFRSGVEKPGSVCVYGAFPVWDVCHVTEMMTQPQVLGLLPAAVTQSAHLKQTGAKVFYGEEFPRKQRPPACVMSRPFPPL